MHSRSQLDLQNINSIDILPRSTSMNMIPGSQAGRAGHALYGPPLPAPSYVSAPAHVYISASASAAVQYAPSPSPSHPASQAPPSHAPLSHGHHHPAHHQQHGAQQPRHHTQHSRLYHPHSPTETRRPRALVSPHSAHPAARAHAWQVRLEGAHAALLADLEAIGDDEGRRRLRLEAYHDLVYRWSWEHEINPGPTGAARL